ncbi:MAG: GTPase ObgE [Candidatus Omnitrophica bacterium]|nr:GTPase ObgE [Candidatus Omnitrophota bacterium]
MFIDNVKIYVKAGDGGKGCRSFYRDKYRRKGIPDGGDGGKGADIIIKADRNLHTLLDFKYQHHFIGKDGADGAGKNKKGKDAEPVIIRVPVGTMVKDTYTNCILADLDKDGQAVIVAYGGKGGKGNQHRIEPTCGQKGEERQLILDLKLIADIGLIGFPNVGKSTLISAISNAHPLIANYPFTTKSPVLAVVEEDERSFVIADIPGLIEGSWQGKGLGDRFLRHIERTKLLVHMIDISGSQGRNPIQDYKIINKELSNYSKEVARKPQIIVANKMDLEGAEKNLEEFKKVIKKKVYPISALKREGLKELLDAFKKRL